MLVMLSGGRDSVCLLHRLRWPAMHMNYGLRAEASADQAFCEELCRDLGIPLRVVRPEGPPVGNLQAWARDERYAAALSLTTGDVAVAHTASDQAETVLYRLLTSPGRPTPMPARRGRIVRPLLSMTRAETTAYCVEHGLSWREDSSNASSEFARNRIRALLATFPGGERNVLRTLDLLLEDEDVLGSLVRPESSVAELRAMHPVLLRLTLREMAGRPVDPERALRGADLGGGLRSVVEHGHLRFTNDDRKPDYPAVELTVPGQIRWGEGVLTAEIVSFPTSVGTLIARPWKPGDRMRPLGMNGHSKTLQDIFTDRKVPRALRHRLPVVESDGEIVWIPGTPSEALRDSAIRFSFELGSA